VPASPPILFSLLAALAFTFSTVFVPRAQHWFEGRGSDRLLQVLLGDGREILANQMFVQADIYFHSGYYPSIFDQQNARTNIEHLTHSAEEHRPHDHDHYKPGEHSETEEEKEHERAMSFMGDPRDIIERFGREFQITEHTHLSGGKEREVLPWLRLSASLDPHRIETYTVAAYWLRRELGNTVAAEEFLREGLRANPESYEILYELGRLYSENLHDNVRARNLWQMALKRWNDHEGKKEQPNLLPLAQITVRLGHLEEEEGNYAKAIQWLELSKRAAANPADIDEQIRAIKAKMASTSKS